MCRLVFPASTVNVTAPRTLTATKRISDMLPWKFRGSCHIGFFRKMMMSTLHSSSVHCHTIVRHYPSCIQLLYRSYAVQRTHVSNAHLSITIDSILDLLEPQDYPRDVDDDNARFKHFNIPDEPFEMQLRKCAAKKDLITGRHLHSLILTSVGEISKFLGCCLVHMFASGGGLLEANIVFSQMHNVSIYAWQAVIEAHVFSCFHAHAINLYFRMQREGFLPSNRIFLCVLGSITKNNELKFGRIVNDDVIRAGSCTDIAIGSCLVDMYAKCGSIAEAQKIFDKLPLKNVVTWNSLIAGYAMAGEIASAQHLLEQMQKEKLCPVGVTFLVVLKACTDLCSSDLGDMISMEIVKFGLDADMVVGNALVDLYAKRGRLQDAHEIFRRLCSQDVVSWNVLISGYVKGGHGASAMDFFWRMQKEGVNPDEYTVSSALQACSSLNAREEGETVYNYVILSGMNMDSHVGSTLLRMYIVCNKLEDAYQVLAGFQKANGIMWGTMISGYIQHELYAHGLTLFSKMQLEQIKLDEATFPSILNACANLTAVNAGMLIHIEITSRSLESKLEIGNALIDMYCKCGCIEEAHQAFDYMSVRDVVTWNSLIAGIAQHEEVTAVLVLFKRMLLESNNPDKVTLLSTLKCCVSTGAVKHAMHLHHFACYDGLELDKDLGSSLVDIYIKLGCLEDATSVFGRLPSFDVVSCSAMVSGYVKQELWFQSTNVYNMMVQKGITPDNISFACLIKACSNIGTISDCNLLYDEIIRGDVDSDLLVGNGLIDMYSKCGWLTEAQYIFEALPHKTLSSWNTIMTGYADNDDGLQVLELFKVLQQKETLRADKVTYLSVLKACGSLGSVVHGVFTHDQIIRSCIEADLAISNTIIDTYARCGALEDAHAVFESLPIRDVVSWSALIAGHAQHRGPDSAQRYFYRMQQAGEKPTSKTFTSILAAYSNEGKVKDGHHFFSSMREEYGITPSIEHCNCMIDILGRSGCLKDAKEFLHSIPISPNVATWMSLLTSCKTFRNIDYGRYCFKELTKLDRHNSSAFMIMSDIYAEGQMWYEVFKLEEEWKRQLFGKKPGKAFIDIGGQVFQFIAGADKFLSGPLLMVRMWKERGYIPASDFLLKAELDGLVS